MMETAASAASRESGPGPEPVAAMPSVAERRCSGARRLGEAAEHRYRIYAGGGTIAEIVRDTQGALVTTVYPYADALGSRNIFVSDG
jgi:hypothetical protein